MSGEDVQNSIQDGEEQEEAYKADAVQDTEAEAIEMSGEEPPDASAEDRTADEPTPGVADLDASNEQQAADTHEKNAHDGVTAVSELALGSADEAAPADESSPTNDQVAASALTDDEAGFPAEKPANSVVVNEANSVATADEAADNASNTETADAADDSTTAVAESAAEASDEPPSNEHLPANIMPNDEQFAAEVSVEKEALTAVAAGEGYGEPVHVASDDPVEPLADASGEDGAQDEGAAAAVAAKEEAQARADALKHADSKMAIAAGPPPPSATISCGKAAPPMKPASVLAAKAPRASAPTTFVQPRSAGEPTLKGTFRTPKGRIITGEALSSALDSMSSAYKNKLAAAAAGSGAAMSGTAMHTTGKLLPQDELDAVVNRLYTSKPEHLEATEKIVHLNLKYDENGKEIWEPAKEATATEQQEYMCGLYSRCIESKKKTEASLAAKYLQPLGQPRRFTSPAKK